MIEKPVDAKNKNQAHSQVWSVWKTVQNAVLCVVKEVVRQKRQLDVNFEHLAKMALGCIAKIAVWEKATCDWPQMTQAFMRYAKNIGMPAIRKSIERLSEEMHSLCT